MVNGISASMGGRNAIDDFGKFDTACLAKRTLADDMTAQTFGEVPTSQVLFDYRIENRLLPKTGSKRDDRSNCFSAEPMAVHCFLNPYSDLRLGRVDMVQTGHSQKFLVGCEAHRKGHIGPGNHQRKPGPANLLEVLRRGRWVPRHVAGQCWG
jgi:hypothetical protein